MREQIGLLVKLQEKDRALNRLRKQIHEGPLQINELESEVGSLEDSLADDKGRIEDVKKLQHQYESEVEDAIGHIKKSKSRLMAIKSNKEYHALLKEIEDTEKANAERENKTLSCMEELESLNQVLESKGKDLSVMRDRLENEKRAIEADVRQAKEQVSQLEKGRGSMVEAIEPKLLARYEQIKARMGGIAIALVENATCCGCHLNIPPQMYNELQKGDSLKFCPHCDRIICWKGHVAES
ncbi:MAG: hypothetical protein HWN68_13505 [Desulfobacterales bacterium]|nr:hypothetical protein [Desulfobacterales bacterium]